MSSNVVFRDSRYAEMAARIALEYVSADPFPHAVIDDFLPTELCDKLLTEFPDPSQIEWMKFDRHHSKKLATKGADGLPPSGTPRPAPVVAATRAGARAAGVNLDPLQKAGKTAVIMKYERVSGKGSKE